MVNADELARLMLNVMGRFALGLHKSLLLFGDVCHYGDVPGELLRSLAGRGPVHSTAFRPIDAASLARNPSAFLPHYSALSLSRTNYYARSGGDSASARYLHPTLSTTVTEYEQRGGFNETQAQEFVQEAWKRFAGTSQQR